MGRWTANGTTLFGLAVYGLAAGYFKLVSSHGYCNQTVAKRIENMKNATNRVAKKRKWTDTLFRKFVNGV